MKGKDRWCPFERDALAQLGLTDEAPRPSADEPVQSATLAQEVVQEWWSGAEHQDGLWVLRGGMHSVGFTPWAMGE